MFNFRRLLDFKWTTKILFRSNCPVSVQLFLISQEQIALLWCNLAIWSILLRMRECIFTRVISLPFELASYIFLQGFSLLGQIISDLAPTNSTRFLRLFFLTLVPRHILERCALKVCLYLSSEITNGRGTGNFTQ